MCGITAVRQPSKLTTGVRLPPRAYGDVAQLGERLPCKQEVAGSTPAVSTTLVYGRTVPVLDERIHAQNLREFRVAVRKFTRSIGSLGARSCDVLEVETPGFPTEKALCRLAHVLGVNRKKIEVDSTPSCDSCGAGTIIRVSIQHLNIIDQ